MVRPDSVRRICMRGGSRSYCVAEGCEGRNGLPIWIDLHLALSFVPIPYLE
jgi:hypothetical protein